MTLNKQDQINKRKSANGFCCRLVILAGPLKCDLHFQQTAEVSKDVATALMGAKRQH